MNRRTARIQQTDGTFRACSFRDIRKGDIFYLVEESGEAATNTALALGDPYGPLDEDVPWSVMADWPPGTNVPYDPKTDKPCS